MRELPDNDANAAACLCGNCLSKTGVGMSLDADFYCDQSVTEES